MLDEFSATKIEDKKPPVETLEGGKASATANDAIPDADEFTKQLQAGMADLIGQLDSDPEMAKEFEEMMKGLVPTAAAEAGPSLTATAPKTPAQGSQSKPSGARKQEKSHSRILSGRLWNMLKEMENGNFPGLEGGEEDFNKMLLGMMEQLTNKDILYEPMKELHEKYPDWLSRNKDTLKKEDLTRYQEQQKLVSEIVGRFERSGYSDDNVQDRDYIIERMQKMQAAGSPPPDLVGDMSSAQEALSDMDAGCPQQ
ncbi:Peroxisome chaperone and import receptor [Taxawa tesnikishii (nom. ined.)]|nr:Peroxisome chaperone and import receptor [Dothideales sp. JES 119]